MSFGTARASRSARLLVTTFLGFIGLAVCLAMTSSNEQSESCSISVSASDLLMRPVAENWPSYNGDYSGQRYSKLAQINKRNVSQLRAQWVFHPGNSNLLEVTPVVVNGVMFVTAANDAFALDARTGRPLWHYSRPITEGLIDDA